MQSLGLADVELVAQKVFIRDLVLVIVYFERNYYAMVQAIGPEQELPLIDTVYPDLTGTAACYIVKEYTDPCEHL